MSAGHDEYDRSGLSRLESVHFYLIAYPVDEKATQKDEDKGKKEHKEENGSTTFHFFLLQKNMYSSLFFPFLIFILILILSLMMWQLVVGYRDAVEKKKQSKTKFAGGIVICGLFLLFCVGNVVYILYEAWKQSQQ